jgi:hypothetical protein
MKRLPLRKGVGAGVLLAALLAAPHADAAPKESAGGARKPAFTLLKGKGIPVCEAYLKRLNATEFGRGQNLPLCGRPENNSIEGFAKLNRVPLTVDQVAALNESQREFMDNGNAGHGNNDTRKRKEGYIPTKEARETMAHGDLMVWQYDPPVDIDNDGKPDNDLIIWHGDVGQLSCGRYTGVREEIELHATRIFSIDWPHMQVNEARTRELVGHPVGGYPLTFQDLLQMRRNRIGHPIKGYPIAKLRKTVGFFPAFRPIGDNMGIFAYQSQYYFDTFFDGWGDFQGKRRSDWGDGKSYVKNNLGDILGVFQRKDGVTKQVCEYRWNEFNKYLPVLNLHYGEKTGAGAMPTLRNT